MQLFWVALIIGGILLTGVKVKTAIDENAAQWIRFDSLFKKYGAQFSVQWTWLKAIALNESNLGRVESVAIGLQFPYDLDNSVSSDGKSWGLMQVTLTTAKDMDSAATAQKLNDPEYSIKLAAQYLNWLKRYFPEGDQRFLEFLIKSYNQGPGNTLNRDVKGLPGYANEYWERFNRNLTRVLEG